MICIGKGILLKWMGILIQVWYVEGRDGIRDLLKIKSNFIIN